MENVPYSCKGPLQLYGTFSITISQEQSKLQYLIANLVASPSMALKKSREQGIGSYVFPSLTPNVFVPELDMLNGNLTSQIYLYL